MNQVLAVLKVALAGLGSVLFVWHLFRVSKWLTDKDIGRQVRRRRVQARDDPFSKVPIEPR
jgi:hypothetical protein